MSKTKEIYEMIFQVGDVCCGAIKEPNLPLALEGLKVLSKVGDIATKGNREDISDRVLDQIERIIKLSVKDGDFTLINRYQSYVENEL